MAGTRPLINIKADVNGTEKNTKTLPQSELYFGMYKPTIESVKANIEKNQANRLLFGAVIKITKERTIENIIRTKKINLKNQKLR